ncbi:unnamed protein product [Litomosoides sigmodontis]|uniref:SEA domain-containing protein n=1 Tax=Litomosoides sigmodontis TaxID=42156 RepID=A0A3P7JLH0_LITSI|nr:unnamed protein product [Litomosoides sigmodontis]
MAFITIKFPSSSPSSSSRTDRPPYPFDFTTFLPNFTTQPFAPIFPTPHKPAITTPPNPTDRLQKRTFLCHMYLLNKANEAYVDHNHFEYRQASQMIQNAIYRQLKRSPLQPYLENVYVWYLYNSDPHLAVEFSIVLLLPSRSNIGLTSVRNVFISILPEIEEQLNGAQIDRDSISIQYLYRN